MNNSKNFSNSVEGQNFNLNKVSSKVNEAREALTNLFENFGEELSRYGVEVSKGIQKTELLVDKFITKIGSLDLYLSDLKKMFVNHIDLDNNDVYAGLQETQANLTTKMQEDGFFLNTFGDQAQKLVNHIRQLQNEMPVNYALAA